MLAYDSVEACQNDLVSKYKLVLVEDSTASTTTTSAYNKNPEIYLDCKTSNLENLNQVILKKQIKKEGIKFCY